MLLRIFCIASIVILTSAVKHTVEDIHRSFPPQYRTQWKSMLESGTTPLGLRPYQSIEYSVNQPIDQSVDVTPVQGTTLSPLDYGADPYGTRDSTAAFQAMLNDFFTVWPNQTRYLSDCVVDLGGSTIALKGGDYLISKPIVFPAGFGNYKMTSGTIRANTNFPKGKYLVHIGNNTDDVFSNCGQCSWSQYIDVTEVLLDSSHIAAGGVEIIGVMGSVLSKLYVIGFAEVGVRIVGGHEVQLINSWFGENLWRSTADSPSSTIGVSIFGYDDVISNVIVFSAGLGAYIKGACNLVQGLHTWNGNANGVWFDGDQTGSASAGSNRIDSSYLDFSNLIITNPWQTLVTNNFFLGGGHIVLRTSWNTTNPMQINGLVVTNNQFNAVPNNKIVPSIELDESAGPFTALIDTTFTANVYTSSYIAASTRIRASQAIVNASEACFDFSKALVFPQFASTFFTTSFQRNGTNIKQPALQQTSNHRHSRYWVDPPGPPTPPSPSVNGGWPSPLLTTKLPSSLAPGDLRGACVEFAGPATGTVFIEVDQSSSSQAGSN